MGVGAAVVRTDRLVLDSVWEAPTSPHPAEMDTQKLKRAGKHTWLLERVVHAVGGVGAACGAMARVASTSGLKVVARFQCVVEMLYCLVGGQHLMVVSAVFLLGRVEFLGEGW
jgi:hypothetical protein